MRINCFQKHRPKSPHILIPFRHVLRCMTSSTRLPRKIFFDICHRKQRLGEVVIATDGWSPRALNFLLISSGLKGCCYQNTDLEFYATEHGNYVSGGLNLKKKDGWNGEAVVKGIRDFGIHEAPTRRGFICGFSMRSKHYLSWFGFVMKDTPGNLLGKFGEVESGLQVLDKITKESKNVKIKECGFVIENYGTTIFPAF